MAKLSIITVAFNAQDSIENTILSVIGQSDVDIEYIVIDGGSSDATLDVISKYRHRINYWFSEPDNGIYDAMNKGVRHATGDWLLFMNAGDEFTSHNVLSAITKHLDEKTEVVYSDWIYKESGKTIKANFNKLNVRHQSVLYRKELHEKYGSYVVGKNVTISDYIFFLSIAHENWKYMPVPISVCEQAGASSNPTHFYQRMASELIFNRRTKLNVCFILLVYPAYRFIKRSILRLR